MPRKDSGLMFRLGNANYKMGSKMFPLPKTGKPTLFKDENTVDFDLPEFAKLIDEQTFEAGRCYLNADIVCQITKHLGIDAEYYSGWVFARNPRPIHHAWVVINQRSVIDTSLSMGEFEIIANVDYSDLNWRKKVAPVLAQNRRTRVTSKDAIFGQVPTGILYVGAPDDSLNARKTFNDMVDAFPEHPCYRHKMNVHGASELQKLMAKADGKVLE